MQDNTLLEHVMGKDDLAVHNDKDERFAPHLQLAPLRYWWHIV